MLRLRWWYGVVFNLALAVLVISGTVFYVQERNKTRENGYYLELRNALSGGLYRRWPMKEGGEFAVEFIHSVHQSPVRETFTVLDGKIRPAAVRFYSFGAGMQSDLEEGQELRREGDALVITGFSRSFKELRYIVGAVSDHLLFVNGGQISLTELCGKNAHITIGLSR